MAGRFYSIAILLGVIAVTSQRHLSSDDRVRKIDQLLHKLDEQVHAHRYDHHHHVRDEHSGNPDDDKLLNVDTLNLIVRDLKRNGKQNLSPESKRLLSELDDALRQSARCGCGRGVGRCGCGGRGRSGSSDDSSEVDEVSFGKKRATDSLNYLAQRGKRYRVSKDVDAVVVDASHLEKLLEPGNRKQKYEVDTDDSEENLKLNYDGSSKSKGKSLNVFKPVDRSDESDAEYRTKSDMDFLQELMKMGKKYKVDNNVDAVVIDIDKLDQSADRNEKTNEDRKLPLANKLNSLYKPNSVLLDLDKIQTADNYDSDSDEEPVNKEEDKELQEYYTLADLKKRLVEDVVDYIRGQKAGIVYNYLSDKQKSLVNILKRQLRQTSRPNIRKLQSQVNNILFPEKTLERGILPKSKNLRIEKPSSRRSNEAPNGVPFELQVEGLAQANP